MLKIYDEDTVKILLIGSENDIEKAITIIDKFKREHLLRIIKNEMYGENDINKIMDIYQEIMLSLWKAAKKEKYDPSGSLVVYLAKIARNKVIDLYRRSKSSPCLFMESENIENAIAEKTKTTSLESKLASENEYQKIQKIIKETIVQFSDLQQRVTLVWLEFFPEEPDWKKISEQVGL